MAIKPLILGVILTTFPSLPAQAQVLRCTEKMQQIADDWLERSVEALKTQDPQIAFPHDDQPCRHARETSAALVRTVARNYLTGLSGYEFVKVLKGDSYFTIERFTSRMPADLRKLEAALNRNHPRKLRIEANTTYDVFMAGDTLVLMISSAVGADENAKLFRHVQQVFSSAAASVPSGKR
jgi:hypothetical protein